MTRLRWTTLLIGLVAAAACSSDPSPATSTSATPASTLETVSTTTEATTSTTEGGGETTTTPAPITTTTTTTTTTTMPGPRTIEIVYRDDEVEGPDTVEVALGERVVLIVTADVEDEVHLHGYDVFADVGPSTAAFIEFDANVPGVFELELEDSGELLVEIEVS